MKKSLIRWVIRWLWQHYFDEFKEHFNGSGFHIHMNPVRKVKVPE